MLKKLKQMMSVFLIGVLAVSVLPTQAMAAWTAPTADTDWKPLSRTGIKARFGVGSDIHIGSGYNSDKKLQNAFNVFETIDPNMDAVMFAGDITDGGLPAQYDTMMGITNSSSLKDKVIWSMGNHEYYGWSGNQAGAINEFVTKTGQEPDKVRTIHSSAPSAVNSTVYSAVYSQGDVTVITLGSHSYDGGRYSDQYDFLKTALSQAASKNPYAPIFIIAHHGVEDTAYTTNEWYGNYVDTDKDMIALMAQYPQIIHISGHSHATLNEPTSIDQSKGFTCIQDATLGAYFENESGKITSGGTHSTYPEGYTDASQALLIDVDSDNKVIVHRMDLTSGKYIYDNEPWVIDIPQLVLNKTFSYTDARKNNSNAPVFASSAQVTVTEAKADSVVFSFSQASAADGLTSIVLGTSNDNIVHSYKMKVTNVKTGEAIKDTNYSRDYYLRFSDYYKSSQAATLDAKISGLTPNTEYKVEVWALTPYEVQSSNSISTTFKTTADAADKQLKTITAGKATNAPVIDGALNDSNWSLDYPVNIDMLGNTATHSANFDASWDDKNLYVAVQVKGDSQLAAGTAWSAGDIVWLYLDPTCHASAPYTLGDGQIGIGYNPSNNNAPYIIKGGGVQANDSQWAAIASSIKASTVATADGWNVEVAIPWNTLWLTPAAGNQLGFDISVDNYKSGSDLEAIIWCLANGADASKTWNDTTGFGRLALSNGDGTEDNAVLNVDFADGTAADKSSVAHRATKLGDPVISYNKDLGKNIASFDGNDDAYAYNLTADDYNKVKSSFTMEAMMKLNQFVNGDPFMNCDGAGFGYELNGDGKTLEFWAHIDGSYVVPAVDISNIKDQWIHATTTYNGSEMKMYINGELKATKKVKGLLDIPQDSAKWLMIGSDTGASGNVQLPIACDISNARLFAKAMTADSVAAMYAKDKAVPDNTQTNKINVNKTAAITMDGDLSEAVWATKHKLEKRIVGNTTEIDASFSTTWDNKNFYIGVDVKGAVADKTNFDNDSITYYFAPHNYRGTPYSPEDFQVQIMNKGNTVIAGATGVGKNDSLAVSDIKVNYKPQTNGYTMEIAMPWSVVGTLPQEGNNVMGFDIMAFSNGDNCVMEWSGGNWIDTTNNGTLTFVCDGTEQVSAITAIQPVFEVNKPIELEYEGVNKNDSIAVFKKDKAASMADALYTKSTNDCTHPSGKIVFTESLLNGDYVAAVIRGDKIIATTEFKVGTIQIITEKHDYIIGEASDLTVKYCNTSGKDWIGVYKKGITPSGLNPSILWKYTGDSTEATAGTMTFSNAINTLGIGEFKVVLLENDGYTVKSEYPFTIKTAAVPQISLTSSTYDVNFDITVYYKNAKTSKDWIGIYKKGTTPSSANPCYAYKYLNAGNGSVSFSPKDVLNYQVAPEKVLSAGEYEFIMMYNDGYDILASANFTLTDINTLSAPKAVNYARTASKAGYADGTVTITKPDDTTDIDYYNLYWGDANGKLDGYNAIVTLGKDVANYTMVKNTFIPANATKLLAYSSNGVKNSHGFAAFDIPVEWRISQSDVISKFEVMSDIHMTGYNSINFTRFGNALKDIIATAPDSKAIFTVGDNVDIGQKENYENFFAIVDQNKTGLPEMNYVIGNHEYFENVTDPHHGNLLTCAEKAQRFLDYTKEPALYYDKYINNQHFIVLGSEQTSVESDNADISDTQFAWLENKLAETKDKKTPIFVFIHQPMANTVAGTIGGKSGQGWNGISDEQEARLRSIFAKYPQVIMFNGHTHWDMESAHEMYDGGAKELSIFNTAGVSMLWTDAQTNKEGSQGVYVETYQDKLLVRGRDFENGAWIPSASFIVDMNEKYAHMDDTPVAPTIASIRLAAPTSLNVGAKSQLIVTAVYSNNTTTEVSKNATYTLSNPNVATVDNSGAIMALSVGQTVITATFEGVSATVTLSVTATSNTDTDTNTDTSTNPITNPSTNPNTDPNTKSNTITVLSDGKVDKELTIKNLSSQNGIYEVQTGFAGNAMQVGFSPDTLAMLTQQNPNAVLQLNAGEASYSLPLNSVDMGKIAKEMGVSAKEVKGSVLIQRVAANEVVAVSSPSSGINGAQEMIAPIEFKVQVSSNNGQMYELEDMGQFVERTMVLTGITDSSHLTGVMYDEASKKYIFVPSTFQTVNGNTTATLKRRGNSIYTVVKYSKTFDDIQNHWAKQAIEKLASKFIVYGDASENFRPDANITRAEFISMIVRSLGMQEDKGSSAFKDVSTQWYAGNVNAASKAGLIKGYEDGTFGPDRNISRQEMVTIICNALKFAGMNNTTNNTNSNKFSDEAAVSTWAKENVALAASYGIISGTPDGKFMPESNATRSETAKMLVQTLKVLKFID